MVYLHHHVKCGEGVGFAHSGNIILDPNWESIVELLV